MKRSTRLTLLGVFIGIFLAVAIGFILYELNRENRFD